eukprot:scaffold34220_cov146-Isochrysis_galbana.AAC.1
MARDTMQQTVSCCPGHPNVVGTYWVLRYKVHTHMSPYARTAPLSVTSRAILLHMAFRCRL